MPNLVLLQRHVLLQPAPEKERWPPGIVERLRRAPVVVEWMCSSLEFERRRRCIPRVTPSTASARRVRELQAVVRIAGAVVAAACAARVPPGIALDVVTTVHRLAILHGKLPPFGGRHNHRRPIRALAANDATRQPVDTARLTEDDVRIQTIGSLVVAQSVEGDQVRRPTQGAQLRSLRLCARREAQLPRRVARNGLVDAGDHGSHALLGVVHHANVLHLWGWTTAAASLNGAIGRPVVAVVVFEVRLGLCARTHARDVGRCDGALEFVRLDVLRALEQLGARVVRFQQSLNPVPLRRLLVSVQGGAKRQEVVQHLGPQSQVGDAERRPLQLRLLALGTHEGDAYGIEGRLQRRASKVPELNLRRVHLADVHVRRDAGARRGGREAGEELFDVLGGSFGRRRLRLPSRCAHLDGDAHNLNVVMLAFDFHADQQIARTPALIDGSTDALLEPNLVDLDALVDLEALCDVNQPDRRVREDCSGVGRTRARRQTELNARGAAVVAQRTDRVAMEAASRACLAVHH